MVLSSPNLCVPRLPCQTAAAVDTTAAVPQFFDGESAAPAPAAPAAIIDEWYDSRRGFCKFAYLSDRDLV